MNRWRLELRYLFGNTPWDSGESPPELLAFLMTQTAGRALDIGCGAGTNLVSFARSGWDAWGVDIALVAVMKARARLARSGLTAHVLCRDVSQPLAFPEPFDMALDLGCSHALRDARRHAYATNLNTWLRPGGTLLVYSFYQTDDDTSGRWLSLDDVVATYTPAFELTSLEKGEFSGRPSAWLRLEKRTL